MIKEGVLDPAKVEEIVSTVYKVSDSEYKTFTVEGMPRSSVHINFSSGEHEGEVVVRPPEDREAYRDERCETYGDIKKGLKISELEKLMSADSLRRFIPRRRNR